MLGIFLHAYLLMTFRACIVKWVTENNRPASIVGDSELGIIMTAGRPNATVPSVSTVIRDINASFAKSREKIGKLLKVSAKSVKSSAHLTYYKEYPGRLHFATDAWTSPNHRAFVAWTVHLQHEGKMLAFLLDIVEVPEVRLFLQFILFLMVFESHTGIVLANAFQGMLERFGLEEKILSVTADNASSNNVQVAALYELENSFDAANHVRCFNHTIQLSGKALIKPFNAGMGKADSGVNHDDEPSLESFDHNDDIRHDADARLFEDGDEEDDGDGESETLSEEELSALMDDTSAVRETVSKVCYSYFCFISYR
ncbi:MAG TPA: hypothetical protein VHX63_00025 [Acidobacteriaceae bacterium]|nr:hypothetical protein [Acidobacteriaceae bacterium]